MILIQLRVSIREGVRMATASNLKPLTVQDACAKTAFKRKMVGERERAVGTMGFMRRKRRVRVVGPMMVTSKRLVETRLMFSSR